MRLPNLSRPLFAAAIIVAGLVMASCAVPAVPDQGAPDQPPATQPPVTVLVVVTATSAQPSEVQPTATATTKSVVVQPTATPTGKAVVVEPTATSTGKPSTVQPTATSTRKPPTTVVPPAASATPTGEANKAPDQKGTGRGTTPATRIAAPTTTPTATSTGEAKAPDEKRTGRGGTTPAAPIATPTATPTPEPSTREFESVHRLYEDKGKNWWSGDKGDVVVYTGERLPPGCEVVKVLGRDDRIEGLHESVSGAMHGWSVTKQNNDPRDFGAKIQWWYNAMDWVIMRLVYIVRQPWNVDCFVPGKMQTRSIPR